MRLMLRFAIPILCIEVRMTDTETRVIQLLTDSPKTWRERVRI